LQGRKYDLCVNKSSNNAKTAQKPMGSAEAYDILKLLLVNKVKSRFNQSDGALSGFGNC
jgi:hypothetical protein